MLRTIFLTLTLLCNFAYGAEFLRDCAKSDIFGLRFCTITMHGTIVSGDADRLRKLLRESAPGHTVFQELILDSLGGNVPEAIKLAGLVKEALLKTSTIDFDLWAAGDPRWYQCVSACFLVWASGTERFSFSYPKGGNFGLGLHRPYFSPEGYGSAATKIAEAQQTMTSMVREFLRRENVPENIIELMLAQSSKEVYWVSGAVEERLNGYSPWFEEMMIARCNFDPAYERESGERVTRLLREKKNPDDDAIYREHKAWKEKYFICQSQVRLQAQKAIRH
jgi:hypothetical protein